MSVSIRQGIRWASVPIRLAGGLEARPTLAYRFTLTSDQSTARLPAPSAAEQRRYDRMRAGARRPFVARAAPARRVPGRQAIEVRTKMRFMNHVKTAMLLGAMLGLCMLIGHFVGGPRGMILGLMFGGIGNVIAFFFSDRIALSSMRARQITREDLPWLHDAVARLAERDGLPMPRVYICPQAAPNAFATGRNPRNAAVAVTEGMLANFPPHEIEGVLAHELGHVKHRDILIATIAATIAGGISALAYMFMFFGGGGDRRDSPVGAIGALLTIILAPIAAGLIKAAISRQREYAADSYGGELCGDPNKLAAALQRLAAANQRIPTRANPAYESLFIVQPLLPGAVTSLFSTHPPIEKRIAALREQAMRMR